MSKKRSLSKKDRKDLKENARRALRATKSGVLTAAQLELVRTTYRECGWGDIWNSACRLEWSNWALDEIPF